MPKVIFDSSFLMAVAERPTAWEADITQFLGKFKPVLLDCVSAELKHLSEGGGKKGKYASLALDLASGFELEVCGGGDVDAEIVSKALSESSKVATADRGLLRTLRARGLGAIGLRGGRVALL